MQGTEQMANGSGMSAAAGAGAVIGSPSSEGTARHPEVAKNGRRPRWSHDEDQFLIDQLRKGLKPKDVVAAYSKSRFAKLGRPENGVYARIDQVKSIAKQTPAVPAEPEGEKKRASTYGATAQICDVLVSYDPQDRRRIMRAVADLMDTDEPSTH